MEHVEDNHLGASSSGNQIKSNQKPETRIIPNQSTENRSKPNQITENRSKPNQITEVIELLSDDEEMKEPEEVGPKKKAGPASRTKKSSRTRKPETTQNQKSSNPELDIQNAVIPNEKPEPNVQNTRSSSVTQNQKAIIQYTRSNSEIQKRKSSTDNSPVVITHLGSITRTQFDILSRTPELQISRTAEQSKKSDFVNTESSQADLGSDKTERTKRHSRSDFAPELRSGSTKRNTEKPDFAKPVLPGPSKPASSSIITEPLSGVKSGSTGAAAVKCGSCGSSFYDYVELMEHVQLKHLKSSDKRAHQDQVCKNLA
jgi:hypothetical protein